MPVDDEVAERVILVAMVLGVMVLVLLIAGTSAKRQAELSASPSYSMEASRHKPNLLTSSAYSNRGLEFVISPIIGILYVVCDLKRIHSACYMF